MASRILFTGTLGSGKSVPPSAMQASPGRICPLCQHEIPADQASCRAGCPLAHGCSLVRCPNCGYEMPGESKLVSLIRRWMGKGDPAEPFL